MKSAEVRRLKLLALSFLREGKRTAFNVMLERMLPSTLLPGFVRTTILRRVGVSIGRSVIPATVVFTNLRVDIGDDVKIHPGTRFEGICPIVIPNGYSFDGPKTITSAVGKKLVGLEMHSPLHLVEVRS